MACIGPGADKGSKLRNGEPHTSASHGIQTAVFYAMADRFKGVQTAAFQASAWEIGGVQAALYRAEACEIRGVQVGAFNHVEADMSGLQLGLFNTAGELHGLQVGLYNRARGGGRRRVERGESRFRRRPVAFRGLVGEAVDVEDGGMRGRGDEETRGDREEPAAVPPGGTERASDEGLGLSVCHGFPTGGTTAKKTSGSTPSLTSVCSWPSGQKWQFPGARVSGTPPHVAVPRPERT